MTKKNRILSVLFAVTVIFVMLFSACFILSEADHNCIGEKCQICFQISVCENTLKTLGLAASIFAVAAATLYYLSVIIEFKNTQTVFNTLILLKVKLSN